ncbi:MAG: Rieske 2Fe-2S domain-containing protein [Ignavibacteria bacterium]|nr:Rieske 2Fe-2S domain-containing protein [Ignavibacteria bacterium]
MEETKGTSRREFLRLTGSFFVVGMAVTTVYPVLTSCERDEELPTLPVGSNLIVDISKYPQLQEIPGIAKIKFQSPIQITLIIKRISQTEFIVFSSICPHQAVELDIPTNPDGNIRCPLHSVEFSSKKEPFGPGYVVANPQGVRVSTLPNYHYEFDRSKNILTIKLS